MDRFWSKVEPTGFCWEWTAGRNVYGYGKFLLSGENRLAHRVAYELLLGAIPNGLTLDHLCRNRGCVNPDHLEAVTQAENARRANALRTHCKRGHEFTPENTYHQPTRGRVCKACRRAVDRKRDPIRTRRH